MRVRTLAVFLCLVAGALSAPPLAAQQSGVAVSISSPQNEETIHDNTGRVPVTVAITGGDPLAAGGSIRTILDGKAFGPAVRAASFALEGVERGEHALRVEVLDAAGTVIAASGSVKFYMWQASVLFPGRKK
jgi:hypothetical protein